MTGYIKQLVFCLLALSVLTVPAIGGALRCGTVLITTGDSADRVERYCGEPTRRIAWKSGDTGRGYVPDHYDGSATLSANVGIEEWVYVFGRYRFTRRVMMENGRVIGIYDGEKGK